MDKKTLKRRADFLRWWNINHHRTKAHVWLSHHSRNYAFSYAFTPEKFTAVTNITKRFFNSEHKKLNQRAAWTLWKLTHPHPTEREKMISRTGAYLLIQKNELREIKRELKK